MSSEAEDSVKNAPSSFEMIETDSGERETVLLIRTAERRDAPAVARILVSAFPALYNSTFGNLGTDRLIALLTHLYLAGNLSLTTTQVAEREGEVVGLAILHFGESIGRGSAWSYGRLLIRKLGLFRSVRAFFGGLGANSMLDRRIPRAPDLVYVEALAVAESERSKGIGARLLQAAMDQTREQGRSRLALHVLQSNTGARRLYQRMGFRPWEHTPARRFFGSLFARRVPTWATLLLVRPVA